MAPRKTGYNTVKNARIVDREKADALAHALGSCTHLTPATEALMENLQEGAGSKFAFIIPERARQAEAAARVFKSS